MTRPYPLTFDPLLKPRPWGGSKLRHLGKAVAEGTHIGESWEIADLPESIPEGCSIVANGPWTGRPLRDLIEQHRDLILGEAAQAPDGGFPLLIKYLDARENLSVQVHPTPAYVETHPGTAVKSEAWYVVEASPDAAIYMGLRPGVTAETLRQHLDDARIVDDLARVPVVAGDCHHLPSGTCHALGAGTLVAEVQTASDTTFRVFDWGRGRELHGEEALACIDFSDAPPDRSSSSPPSRVDGLETTPLLTTDSFTIERVDITTEEHVAEVTNQRPVIWMTLAGAGSLSGGGQTVQIRRGVTVLLPAALEESHARLETGTSLLRVTTPDPRHGWLAG